MVAKDYGKVCPDCGKQCTGQHQFVKGFCRPCYNNRYIKVYRAAGRHKVLGRQVGKETMCDCGREAVHKNVTIGGYAYHLCQKCHDLEVGE